MSDLAARLTGLLWLAVLVFLAVPADWHPFVDGAFAGVAVYLTLSAIVNSLFRDENRSPQ